MLGICRSSLTWSSKSFLRTIKLMNWTPRSRTIKRPGYRQSRWCGNGDRRDFPLALAAAVWREIVAGRNFRNMPIAALLTLFAMANLLDHAGAQVAVLDGVGIRLALGVAALMIALVGGRVTPSFTRNWMARAGLAPLPAPMDHFDRAALAVTAVALLTWIAAPEALRHGSGPRHRWRAPFRAPSPLARLSRSSRADGADPASGLSLACARAAPPRLCDAPAGTRLGEQRHPCADRRRGRHHDACRDDPGEQRPHRPSYRRRRRNRRNLRPRDGRRAIPRRRAVSRRSLYACFARGRHGVVGRFRALRARLRSDAR